MVNDVILIALLVAVSFQAVMIVGLWMAVQDLQRDMHSVGRLLGRMMTLLEFHSATLNKHANVVKFQPRS